MSNRLNLKVHVSEYAYYLKPPLAAQRNCIYRDAMRCDATRRDAMRCDATRCDAMRCDAMRLSGTVWGSIMQADEALVRL
jgi:pentapeptide MXKDX repeat protein